MNRVGAVQSSYLVSGLAPVNCSSPLPVNSAASRRCSTSTVVPLLAHTHTRWSGNGEVLASDPPPSGQKIWRGGVTSKQVYLCSHLPPDTNLPSLYREWVSGQPLVAQSKTLTLVNVDPAH